MPALVAGIHVFIYARSLEPDVDGRNKSDHDDEGASAQRAPETSAARPTPAGVSRTMAWSSAARKLERSRGANGFGPPVISPALRSESIRLRVASVMPIESAVKSLPFGAMTVVPDFTQRLASGTSAVITTSPRPARSAIQL